jgi:hypothetical protein
VTSGLQPGEIVAKRCRSILAVALFVSPRSPARDWIVNPESGADTNAGSVNAPLATAQAAVDKAGPGDRVVLQPEKAVYRQSIDLSKAPSGLVLDGNGVTLDGEGQREHGILAMGNNRNVKVFQINLRNFAGDGFAVGGKSRGFQFFGILSQENQGCWLRGERRCGMLDPGRSVHRSKGELSLARCRGVLSRGVPFQRSGST